MINMKVGCILVAVVTMTLMLTVAPLYAGSALAVKKSTSSVKTPKGTTTTSTHHVKGVKVFRVICWRVALLQML